MDEFELIKQRVAKMDGFELLQRVVVECAKKCRDDGVKCLYDVDGLHLINFDGVEVVHIGLTDTVEIIAKKMSVLDVVENTEVH